MQACNVVQKSAALLKEGDIFLEKDDRFTYLEELPLYIILGVLRLKRSGAL